VKRDANRGTSKRRARPAPVAQPQAGATPPTVEPFSVRPLSAAGLRARLKAQRDRRLLDQVDHRAKGSVDGIMASGAVWPVAAKAEADRSGTVIGLGFRGLGWRGQLRRGSWRFVELADFAVGGL